MSGAVRVSKATPHLASPRGTDRATMLRKKHLAPIKTACRIWERINPRILGIATCSRGRNCKHLCLAAQRTPQRCQMRSPGLSRLSHCMGTMSNTLTTVLATFKPPLASLLLLLGLVPARVVRVIVLALLASVVQLVEPRHCSARYTVVGSGASRRVRRARLGRGGNASGRPKSSRGHTALGRTSRRPAPPWMAVERVQSSQLLMCDCRRTGCLTYLVVPSSRAATGTQGRTIREAGGELSVE